MKCVAGINESAALRALGVRNAALHLALVDRNELRVAVADCVRIVDQLLVGIGAEQASFWGGHFDLATQLMSEQQAEVAHIVAAKIEAAREQLAKITASLPPELAAAVLAHRSRCLTSSDHEEPVTCPVCGQEAWLICGIEKGSPEPVRPDEESWVVSVTAWPFAVECSVCGLGLEDRELGQFEFPDYLELEPEEARPPWSYEQGDWDD
jgi:hypothetical protein